MPSDAVVVVSMVIGWLSAAGSTLLYTPMIFRVLRKRSADGLVVSTWWLKFSSYSAMLVYNVVHGFPLNTCVRVWMYVAWHGCMHMYQYYYVMSVMCALCVPR